MPLTLTLDKRAAIAGLIAAAALGGGVLIGAAGHSSGAPGFVYAAAPAAAQSGAATPGITVTGVGSVRGTPDVLSVNVSVTQTRPDVSGALSAASATMDKVVGALKSRGVADADLQTSGVSVQPNYQYANGSSQIDGYTATESLVAKLRDLGGAGAAISAAAQAAGDAARIDGVAFDLQNDSTLMGSARAAAFADAKLKAQQYAAAAGRPLGAVISVSESVANASPTPVDAYAASGARAPAVPVPVSPGSAQVSVTVTVVFAVG